jgi:hypothetical protein
MVFMKRIGMALLFAIAIGSAGADLAPDKIRQEAIIRNDEASPSATQAVLWADETSPSETSPS